MDFPSTFEKVRKLLYLFIHNGMPTKKAEGPTNTAPAADTEAHAAKDGAPAAKDAAPAVKDILLGPMSPVTAFHPANVAYRQRCWMWPLSIKMHPRREKVSSLCSH